MKIQFNHDSREQFATSVIVICYCISSGMEQTYSTRTVSELESFSEYHDILRDLVSHFELSEISENVS